jgi:hypothetical protein
MDFGDAPPEREFRLRLRAWLGREQPGPAGLVDGRRVLGRAGRLAPVALRRRLLRPVVAGEVGGQGLPSVYDVIVDEELAAAGAPPRPSVGYLVQGILGTATRRPARFLPGLVSGRERWCQGFSEPDAGSDLASLRTRADRDGDDYVITGHKVWTSYSDDADWCLLLARTDPTWRSTRASPPSPSRCASPASSSGRCDDQRHHQGVRRGPLRRGPGAGEHDRRARRGLALAMTVVSHEREPGELGYVARYGKLVNELATSSRKEPDAFGPEQRAGPRVGHGRGRDAAVPREPPALGPAHGLSHGPEGSVDKLLMTAGEQASAMPRWPSAAPARRRRRHLAEGVPLQSGPERHGRHVADPAQPHRRRILELPTS